MKKEFYVIGLCLLMVCAGFSSALAQADFILYNGKVITVDPQDHIYQAVAIKDGKILHAGSDQEMVSLAGLFTKRLNLHGKTVTPGLIDSHYHMMYYGAQFWPGYLNIRHPVVKSKADVLQVVGDYAKTLQPDEWISGNQGFVTKPDETLDRYDLDGAAPNNPVYLRHSSGQFSVVNSRALEIAGITKETPNPHSSKIIRDAQGEPTGVLSHYPAENLVGQYATGYGDRSEEQKLEDIDVGQQHALEAGYTSLQDVIVGSSEDIQLYKKYADSGKLKIRLYAMLYLNTEEQANYVAQNYQPIESGRFKFGGWKLAMDGGFAAKTILFYDKTMYASELSYPYFDQETLNRMVQTLHNTGLQVAVHVSGDEGIDMTLAAFEQAMKANPRSDPRHRIEHGLFPTSAAGQKMADLGVILSTQPQWILWYGESYQTATSDASMMRLLPFQTMLGMGIHLAFGCDVPASPYQEPKYAFAGAAGRRTQAGTQLTPLQKLTPQQALRVHTMGSAYASFSENLTGSLESGKYADLVVWNRDIYSATSSEINDLAAEMTIVNGDILFDSGANSYSYATGLWSATGEMLNAHQDLTATLLNNGKALFFGGNSNQAELYNPATGTFSATGVTLKNHRDGSSATLLNDGRVLIAGGSNASTFAEIYDPATGLFSLTGTLYKEHCYHSATLLPDGRVLIAGGQEQIGPQTHAAAELFDPATGTFALTGSLVEHRSGHTATLLPDGRVLLTGGLQTTTPGNGIYLNSCELYDPSSGAFSAAANIYSPRVGHTATLLADGRALIAGGAYYSAQNELYDYKTGAWSLTSPMNVSRRSYHTATLLPSGKVLIAGGSVNATTRSVEVFYPDDNTFGFADSMITPRQSHDATLLSDGRVLVSGGYSGSETIKLAEIYAVDAAKVVGIDQDEAKERIPATISLTQNFPNPFNPVTSINYILAQRERVRIVIYNLRGEKIVTLVDGERPAGEHRASWNGRSESGEGMGSGLYLLRMEAGPWTATRKLMLVK